MTHDKVKPVYGFESIYFVSENGDVFNSKGEQRKPQILHGYKRFNLCKNGVYTHYSCHRIVLEAFDRPKKNGEVCRHLDGNRLNNHYTNLKWGSSFENYIDTRHHGNKHPRAILTQSDVDWIKENCIKGDKDYSLAALGKKFNVHYTTIQRIVNGKNWLIPFSETQHLESKSK